MKELCKLTSDLPKEIGTSPTLLAVLVRVASLCCPGCLLDLRMPGFSTRLTEVERLGKDVPFKQTNKQKPA